MVQVSVVRERGDGMLQAQPADFGAVNYREASRRHYADAERLWADERVPNASQLHGVAAECAIKWLAIRTGLGPTPGGSVPMSWKKHLPNLMQLLNQHIAQANGKTASTYTALMPNLQDFADWTIDHRYSVCDRSPLSAPRWRQAAKETQAMLEQAVLNGLAP